MITGSSNSLISVIIAAYNAAPDIRATLESAQAQTHTNLEIIVVDDGSTDATAAIVEEFAGRDARVRLIRQPNLGVGAARNAGIQTAQSSYIAPLDADDLWEPDKLAKQLASLEDGGPDVGMVYCWSRRIDEHGTILSQGHPYTVEGRIHRALILRNLLGGASVPLIRRSALEDVGLYLTRAEQHGGQGCEDWDLYLRIAEKHLVHVVPENLVRYRQRRSCMSLNIAGMTASYHAVFARARARSPQEPRALFRWSAGQFHSYLAVKSYLWGFYRQSLVGCLRAMTADPILILSRRLHRFTWRSVFHLLTGGRFRPPRRTEPLRDESTAASAVAAPQDLIGRIEGQRWTFACKA